MVEGLEDGRWALISKVHHCMVDSIAGTDLMQLVFDLTPDATHGEPQDWAPQRNPSSLEVVAGAVQDAVAHPLREFTRLSGTDGVRGAGRDRKSTRLNSRHANISYAALCLKLP